METARKYVSILLLLVLCVTFSFSAFAAPVATPSQIQIVPEELEVVKATPSQILHASSLLSVPTIVNTVDYDGVNISLNYYNSTGVSNWRTYEVGSDGYVSVEKPDNYSQFICMFVNIESPGLPMSGKYKFQMRLSVDAGGVFQWGDNCNLEAANSASNVDSYYVYSDMSYQQDMGDFYCSAVVDTSNYTRLSVRLFQASGQTFKMPFKFYVKAAFSRTSEAADGPDLSGITSTGDIENNINNVVGGISSGVSDINGSIRELIQTIINQLDALWNQFAGEFTNMFAAWQTHTDAIVSAIQNITTAASDGIENIIQAGHNDADQISGDIQSAEEEITGGYDNSGMTSDNDRLDSSLQEYDSAEDALISDAEDAINGVDFDIDLTSFSGIIATISGFLQDCYENSGEFQIVINLTLLCSLASCVIGLYRFKGGG